ncbi:MAG: MCE family protein [Phycisphaerae bacterium]|nr:MCE family protein [Phycisphaerae bacterium]
MRSRFRDFLVGVSSIVALTGFAVLLLLFGELATLMQSRYPLLVNANTSAGLRVGSQVTMNGVVIGTISRISLEPDDSSRPVRILAMIDDEISVPLAVEPAVGVSLLGGGQRMDLVIPPDLARGAAVADRSAPSSIAARFETLSDMLKKFEPALESLGTALADAQRLFEKAGVALDQAGGTIGKAGEAFDQARSTLAKAEEWLADEQFREDLRSTLFNARQAMSTIGRILDGVERDAPKLLASLTTASDQLTDSLNKVNDLLRQAREGHGTVGKLMSNPDLYDSLNDAAQRLSSVLRQAQLLLEKIKQEGLDVKF